MNPVLSENKVSAVTIYVILPPLNHLWTFPPSPLNSKNLWGQCTCHIYCFILFPQCLPQYNIYIHWINFFCVVQPWEINPLGTLQQSEQVFLVSLLYASPCLGAMEDIIQKITLVEKAVKMMERTELNCRIWGRGCLIC